MNGTKKTNCIRKGVNGLALALVKQTANSACIWIAHQPRFPEEAGKFKKAR